VLSEIISKFRHPKYKRSDFEKRKDKNSLFLLPRSCSIEHSTIQKIIIHKYKRFKRDKIALR
jgi:hypothetical protein